MISTGAMKPATRLSTIDIIFSILDKRCPILRVCGG
jgi:hypothetical protein